MVALRWADGVDRIRSVMRINLGLFLGMMVVLVGTSGKAGEMNTIAAAQAHRAKGEPVLPAADGNLYCEAEEFRIETPGWTAQPWGANYYAATFANAFLSRKAFLGAPENGDETVATINVKVEAAGRYLVLVRYEAAYRFETQFRVRVEQNDEVKLDRLYGARDNLKIWAFGRKLEREVAWSWGAVENVVWEGHDAYADLQPGLAQITLLAGRQPPPQARRNVDLVLLTMDEKQVEQRIEEERYLPLDGMLTQTGDVWMEVTNTGQAEVTVTSLQYRGGPWQQHSPYWVHMRAWQPISLAVGPGKRSDWIEVGSTMDALNDGQWGFESNGPCRIAFGVKDAAGQIERIAAFSAHGRLLLAGHADTRYSRLIRTQEQVLYELLVRLKNIPVHGRIPTRTLIYGYTFELGLSPKWNAAVQEFRALYHLRLTSSLEPGPGAYVDWRERSPAQLEEACQKLSDQEKRDIAVVSLGDEIALPTPDSTSAAAGFVAFLQARGMAPHHLDPDAGGDWSKITYHPDPKLSTARPGLYYWSRRYLHHYGIAEMKKRTDILRRHLPNAHIGANFSPHHGGPMHTYLGPVFQWVHCFRKDGMTLPWSEDYIWQTPVGTPQMNGINLDLFRAGLRGKPDRKILYYVMPHCPGNTPSMWRRLFHNALAHGMKIVNLFEFRPVWNAYTENHVTGDEMYGMVLRTLRELGLYEDIVQAGQVKPAKVALWFSETADIWGDNRGSFAAAKRALYIAILHSQVPLDFLVEQDALDGTIEKYEVLYVTDRHVSRAASSEIAAWVEKGGSLFATAGAGMFDEYNQPNDVMERLLGVRQDLLYAPADSQVGFIKQDLPFIEPVGQVTWKAEASEKSISAFGVLSRVRGLSGAETRGVFQDGSPAVLSRDVGAGRVTYCAFLPGLSYFQRAIPRKPLDRGSTDDAMAHLIPTQFDVAAGELIGSAVATTTRPILSDMPLIEASVIESPKGHVIVLTNWGPGPVKDLRVRIRMPMPSGHISLASGKPIKVGRQGTDIVCALDLEVADVLIFRP